MNQPKNIKEIKKFAEEIKIDVKYLLGEKYEGSLYLPLVKTLPDNIVFNVGGSLWLHSVETLPDNIKFNVGGYLWLGFVRSLPDNIVFNVGGYLNLQYVETLPDNIVFNVAGGLSLFSVQTLPDNIVFNVGGNLNLFSVQTLPDNIVFNVGGNLNLFSVQTLPDNIVFNVGGCLDLRSVQTLPKSYDITLGYDCNVFSNLPFVYKNIGENEIQSWENGKYIKVDGIFCEVIKDRKTIKTCKKIGSDKVFYIVTDGLKYAHGSTIKQAKQDLIYKISSRDKSRYENLKLSSSLTLAEAIECYRVITGACEFGTKSFLSSIKPQQRYTIKEIIKLTKDQFGNQEFKSFFCNI